jgi:hypothetical protein
MFFQKELLPTLAVDLILDPNYRGGDVILMPEKGEAGFDVLHVAALIHK